MNELNPENQPQSPEELSQNKETTADYADTKVTFRQTGARLSWSADKTELSVNTTLFTSEHQAKRTALYQVAKRVGLQQAFRRDAGTVLDIVGDHNTDWETIFRWQGLARLRGEQTFSEPDFSLDNQNRKQEFLSAIDTYTATGRYPAQVTDEVKQVLERIPRAKGQNLIDYLASGRYVKFDGQNFRHYLQPLMDELDKLDKQTGQSSRFEYRPPQTQDLQASKEPIQESDILVKVEPFYGGYYREQVCYYDPKTQQIVREAGKQFSWDTSLDLESVDEETHKNKQTYTGIFYPGQDNLAKLPYGARPNFTSLQPVNLFKFMYDSLGNNFLVLKDENKPLSKPTEFSFDFILNASFITGHPAEKDVIPLGGDLDDLTTSFLEDLAAQNWLSKVQKAREITRYVRNKLKYPQDAAEIGRIDELYQATKPQQLWLKIVETGVAHCYWANIFRDELCKRLEIASRIATGPYVASKDPRFDFAIVEAKGMDKHAWGEVWDEDKSVWTHQGMDATPPREQDDQQDEDREDSEPQDGDFGESMAEQPEISEQEIQELYEQLQQEAEDSVEPPTAEQTPEQRAREQFEQEKGVQWQDWQRFKQWVERVNQTPVPPEWSITKKPSTFYEEWRQLFKVLYQRRELPYQVFKGPVRQSEGEFLDDPVTAYIDVRSHDDDPLGYQREHQKIKEQIEVSTFDDDFILDISGSMSGQPGEEQRKMVLSSLYNIKNLNERLNHSRYKNNMTTPLTVRSHVATFGNWTETVQKSDQTIDEKSLLQLESLIREQNQSSKGLAEALREYQGSLDPQVLAEIRAGQRSKVLTIVSDGEVEEQANCTKLIGELRAEGIIVQGIGFGSSAQDIRVVCHDPADPEAAVVIDDVTQATLTRHKLLMKQLTRL